MVGALRELTGRARDALIIARLTQRGIARPQVAPAAGSADRVFIGPANSAGQGFRWARALERCRSSVLVTSAQFVMDDAFEFDVDLKVHAGYAAHSRRWQRGQFETLRSYRAVIIESNRGVLAGYRGTKTLGEIRLLQESGVAVALLFHGSDIRDPDIHMSNEPDSYFQVDTSFTQSMRDLTERSQQTIRAAQVPVFVSTVDLLRYVPDATWLPVVVDSEMWATSEAPLTQRALPRVVHIPSSSHIKGTDLVEEQLDLLHQQGVIEYCSVRGVPHSEMPDLYRNADIVLDQFRGGPYGVAACEALAAGRIVISHVPDRDRVQTLTGEELPIIEATHETLTNVLREILRDPSSALACASRGPGFIGRVHNGDWSGRQLNNWLERDRS